MSACVCFCCGKRPPEKRKKDGYVHHLSYFEDHGKLFECNLDLCCNGRKNESEKLC